MIEQNATGRTNRLHDAVAVSQNVDFHTMGLKEPVIVIDPDTAGIDGKEALEVWAAIQQAIRVYDEWMWDVGKPIDKLPQR